MTGTAPMRFAIVGTGFRTAAYRRLCRAFPQDMRLTAVVTRSPEQGGQKGRDSQVTRDWGVPATQSLGDAVAIERPDFVVASVPRVVAPEVIRAAIAMDLPVLTETPPAPDLPGLRALWADVGPSGLVQVAEQYPSLPGHSARRRLVVDGVLGTVTNVQVSSTHQYHALALIRSLLGTSFRDAAVTAHRSTFPLVDPLDRAGWTRDLGPRPASTVIGYFDFGEGQTALYDFTTNQSRNELRTSRMLVRGSHGELINDHVVRIRDETTIVESDLVRRQTGLDLNGEGFDLDHISFEGAVVFRNRWQGGRLSDDEIALASVLDQMGAWVCGTGAPPYPLAEACQDHMLALAMDESLARGGTVHTEHQPWALERA